MTHLKNTIISILFLLALGPGSASALTRIMPLGDSITQGGLQYVSYRYALWFDLVDGNFDVDFVGQREFTYGGSPDPTWYPYYATTFDLQHEGYWGYRTNQIAPLIPAIMTAGQPDLVLIHLGTNDVGQSGVAGVVNANTYLRLIIGRIRDARPQATILLAQIIPIGPGSSYYNNAGEVATLNSVIATIAADSTSVQSPIIVVDQNSGYDVGTMMQADGIHPNLAGEYRMAQVWLAALAPLLTPPNPAPTVAITAPSGGSVFSAPATLTVEAAAADSNGVVTEVSFYDGATLLGTDDTGPYTFDWFGVPLGGHSLTAVATDDGGASSVSEPVEILVLQPGGGVPVAVADPSFEDPLLADGERAAGPGTIGGWTFSGNLGASVGIMNPPVESYASAGGSGAPTGADSSNAAYLFQLGGAADSACAVQVLGETLATDTQYTLAVAIGKFLPGQPYEPATYGGYRIELLAGATVIAQNMDGMEPAAGEFCDAFSVVVSDTLDPGLIGQTLSIRLGLSAADSSRSTHFDQVRLSRRSSLTTGAPTPPAPAGRLVAFPNPFSDRTRILLSGTATAGRPVVLSVFDVTGRQVRRLEMPPGSGEGWWDGRTESGRTAPAGVYFLRAVIDGRPVGARLVKLR